MKKYLVCSKDIPLLEDNELWAIVAAENEIEAKEIYIEKKGIKSNSFLSYLDNSIFENTNLQNNGSNNGNLLLKYLCGNMNYYNIINSIYDEGKSLYDEYEKEIDLRVTDDLLVYLYKLRDESDLVAINIDKEIVLRR